MSPKPEHGGHKDQETRKRSAWVSKLRRGIRHSDRDKQNAHYANARQLNSREGRVLKGEWSKMSRMITSGWTSCI